MKYFIRVRSFASLLVIVCMLSPSATAIGRGGEKNYKRGMEYEAAQQWERAAQEFTLAVAAEPSNIQYQLHYRRALFNASQSFMKQGRALADQRDYSGAYNAFRQAYGYDPVNQLAASEMERILRLQREKEGAKGNEESSSDGTGAGSTATSYRIGSESSLHNNRQMPPLKAAHAEQLRVITFSGDLKSFIRSLADHLNLNVIFDSPSFHTPRNIEITLRDVTTAKALDYIFLQEGLFFEKLDRHTILVADQAKRPQFQQLVIRTFYLSNIDPNEARTQIQQALPAQQGRLSPNVIPNKSTNSITVRDTAENIQLIGELLQGIDKDQAEVVMDVNIYEMQRTDILQLGNQLGTAANLGNLGGTSALSILSAGRQVATALSPVSTALGAAIAIPPSVLSAFQQRDRNRLLASTQIHAFDRESSKARIGQRVPVQTAQVASFGFNSGGNSSAPPGGTTGLFGGAGFPVISYEPVGLTLDFTPQVFPNLDVQVKMNIESKDVQGIGSLTPTFTERSITGTARIQNNQTMMIASVAQDNQSRGSQGLPLLGLIPVLGRLFSTPTRNNFETDIVITVTPHVLRAPAILPHDKDLHRSGTQQTPTTESLEAMMQESEREDQLAATQHASATNTQASNAQPTSDQVINVPKDAAAQMPSADYVPAPKSLMTSVPVTGTKAGAMTATVATEKSGPPRMIDAMSLTTEKPVATTEIKSVEQSKVVSIPPAVVASTVTEKNGPIPGGALSPDAEFYMLPEQQVMHVGEKRRLMLLLKTDAQIALAALMLKFDPRVITVTGVTQGNLSVNAPTIMQSSNPPGTLLVSMAPPKGAPPIAGAGVLIFIDIEAIARGESILGLDREFVRLVSPAGLDITVRLPQNRIIVKQ